MRIWIAGGGTGGHVYPSLAVVQALVAEGETRFFGKNLVSDTPHILYVGGEGGVEERLVAQAGLRFAGVPAGGMHGLAPWRAARNLIKLLLG
ncbi:MAG: glycosyltransferase, partial [Chloroflexi bacterium]|nr:glycosyltransferase [Chloroflexota bacterium]